MLNMQTTSYLNYDGDLARTIDPYLSAERTIRPPAHLPQYLHRKLIRVSHVTYIEREREVKYVIVLTFRSPSNYTVNYPLYY